VMPWTQERLGLMLSSTIPRQEGTYPDTTHSTSIPPHSNTRNNVRSNARTASTPTTSVQNDAPSSASRANRLPGTRAHIVSADSAEEHEDAGDNVGRGRDAHLRRLFIRFLRDETQGDVFVLE